MHRNDYDITGSIQTTSAAAVGQEVLRLYQRCYPKASSRPLERAFDDIELMYTGRYPHYGACETEYHDIQHVLDVTLAMTRLMHGYETSRARHDETLAPPLFIAGALGALFHDFGYLRRHGDHRHRYGAEYTVTHVSRSAAFLRQYMRKLGFRDELARLAATLQHFTGYERAARSIRVGRGLPRLVGQMLGTADIIAQMSDRCYLEKCRDRLYPEFVLGELGRPKHGRKLPVFASGAELVAKTPGFYEGATRRLNEDLGRSYEYAARHFGGENPYLEGIRKNVSHAAQPAPVLRRRPPSTLLPHVEPYPRHLVSLGGSAPGMLLQSTIAPLSSSIRAPHTMKRKYGAAKSRETIAEQRMREAAQQMKDNSHNYGSTSRMGAVSRGKVRSRAARAGGSK